MNNSNSKNYNQKKGNKKKTDKKKILKPQSKSETKYWADKKECHKNMSIEEKNQETKYWNNKTNEYMKKHDIKKESNRQFNEIRKSLTVKYHNRYRKGNSENPRQYDHDHYLNLIYGNNK